MAHVATATKFNHSQTFLDRNTKSENLDGKCLCMTLVGMIVGATLPIFVTLFRGFNYSEASKNSTIISVAETVEQTVIVVGLSCIGTVLGGIVGLVSFCTSTMFSYLGENKKA